VALEHAVDQDGDVAAAVLRGDDRPTGFVPAAAAKVAMIQR
jgi:hypothetical protein